MFYGSYCIFQITLISRQQQNWTFWHSKTAQKFSAQNNFLLFGRFRHNLLCDIRECMTCNRIFNYSFKG